LAVICALALAGVSAAASPDAGALPSPPGGRSPSFPSAAQATPEPVGPRTLVWSDEFSGAKGTPPDPASWRHEVGGSGWGNGELECYTRSTRNSALDGRGHLVLTARKAPGHTCADGVVNDYTSARLKTQRLQTFRYGRLAIRAKMPVGQGLWPAFWALGTNAGSVGWPACGEIDVVEQLGQHPRTSYGTIHGADSAGKQYSEGGSVTEPRPWRGFHTYAADWTHRSIAFSIDGKTYFTAKRGEVVRKYGVWPFDHPFFLLVNVAVGGSWPGPPDGTTHFPQRMVIDWIRVSQQQTPQPSPPIARR
jgi:beta-glucanase (GH16 family)